MSETELQKQERLKKWADGELHDIESGGCSHCVWAQKDIRIADQVFYQISPVVRLANDDDGFYCQTFKNRKELDAFINNLEEAANEAWGEK